MEKLTCATIRCSLLFNLPFWCPSVLDFASSIERLLLLVLIPLPPKEVFGLLNQENPQGQWRNIWNPWVMSLLLYLLHLTRFLSTMIQTCDVLNTHITRFLTTIPSPWDNKRMLAFAPQILFSFMEAQCNQSGLLGAACPISTSLVFNNFMLLLLDKWNRMFNDHQQLSPYFLWKLGSVHAPA